MSDLDLDAILTDMAEPVYDRSFRDRLLRHRLSHDEVRQLAEAIDRLQKQAATLLTIRQRAAEDGTFRRTLGDVEEKLWRAEKVAISEHDGIEAAFTEVKHQLFTIRQFIRTELARGTAYERAKKIAHDMTALEGLRHLRASTAVEEWWPIADKAITALEDPRVLALSDDPRMPLWVLRADRHIGDIEWWSTIPVRFREQVRIEAALDRDAIPEELDR